MYVHFVILKLGVGVETMATRNRSGLGRPPLPEDYRKGGLTCYLPVRVIERLGELAERQGTSRNKLVTHVLSDFVATADRDGGRPGPQGVRTEATG